MPGSGCGEEQALENWYGCPAVDLSGDDDISTKAGLTELSPAGAGREVIGNVGGDGTMSFARDHGFGREVLPAPVGESAEESAGAHRSSTAGRSDPSDHRSPADTTATEVVRRS
jgi:hypothetical protein